MNAKVSTPGELAADELPPGARDWLSACAPVAPHICTRMAGGAGARRYWRIADSGGRSCVFMWALPEDPAILPPALRAPDCAIPFVEVARFLESEAVPVPSVYAVDEARRFVALEDLGSRHLLDLQGSERARAYEQAIDLLAHVHSIRAPAAATLLPLPFRRSFDAEWLEFEMGLFRAMRWSTDTAERLGAALAVLVARIAELPRVVSLRDYQSQNLLLDGSDRLRVIDFQDALLAAPGLDLAALLWDSYVDLRPEERRRLLERYAGRAPRPVDESELALLTLHRKCKDLSRYRRVLERGPHPLYEAAQGRAIGAIRSSIQACSRDAELAELCDAVERALGELGLAGASASESSASESSASESSAAGSPASEPSA